MIRIIRILILGAAALVIVCVLFRHLGLVDIDEEISSSALCQAFHMRDQLEQLNEQMLIGENKSKWHLYINIDEIEEQCGSRLTIEDDRVFDSRGDEVLLKGDLEGELWLVRVPGRDGSFTSFPVNEIRIEAKNKTGNLSGSE